MLKIVPSARRTAFLLLCSLPIASLASARAQAATAPQRLSTEAFNALSGISKAYYLQGLTASWQTSADGRDFAAVQAAVDSIVAPDGSLRSPVAQAQPFGRAILLCFRVTRNPRYATAANALYSTLQPQQDKEDMSVAPFLADFGITFQEAPAADQAADILLRIDSSSRDLETGLLRGTDLAQNTYFAYDLLETVDRLPIGFHHRRGLTEALNKSISSLIARHGKQEIWQTPGHSPETLLLDAYIVARGVRLGDLAQGDANLANRMMEDSQVASPTPASAGARLLAESEQAQASTQAYAQGKTVTIDAWFNSQAVTTPEGHQEFASYKWDNDANAGFSFFGRAFKRYGAELDTLRTAPTAARLSASQVYIVVSPEPTSINPAAHALTRDDADAIETWVRDGGVLVLMMNDTDHAEFTGVNALSERFGMHFNPVRKNLVEGTEFGGGTVQIPSKSNVFSRPHRVFLKDICTITLGPAAHPVLKDGEDTIMAVASVGRGTVFAVTDPWLYNEYTDGRKLPSSFDNYAAAIDLAGWLLKQTQQ